MRVYSLEKTAYVRNTHIVTASSMNLKFTLFLIAAVQLLLLEKCHCRPLFSSFSSLFDEPVAPPPHEIDPIPSDSGVAENTLAELDAVNAVPSAEPVTSTIDEGPKKKPFRLAPTDMAPGQPALGGAGFPWALNTVAAAARLLNGGVRGTKALIEGSTDLTAQALGGVRRAGNGLIDGVQGAINRGADRTLNRVSGWMDKTNTYRKGLSGTTAKPTDQGHSITITTTSDAPVQSFTDFISQYLPSGTSNASLMPQITSIDLSKLW